MPLITQIADAVVAELNAATFSQPVTATRAYVPRFELPELKTLTVTVVPSSASVTAAAHGAAQQDVAIDIAVQQKLDSEQNAALDPLLALAEEIAEHFRGKRLSRSRTRCGARPSLQRCTPPSTSNSCARSRAS